MYSLLVFIQNFTLILISMLIKLQCKLLDDTLLLSLTYKCYTFDTKSLDKRNNDCAIATAANDKNNSEGRKRKHKNKTYCVFLSFPSLFHL